MNKKSLLWVLTSAVILASCAGDDHGAGLINETGRYTLMSSGMEREYYVQLPTGYAPEGEAPPLLIALHGAGDSIDGWLEGGFQGDGLLRLTRDDAIMVIPNARVKAEGRRIWDPGTETDYTFFLDLLAELDQRITYDKRRIFITGHSAGALMTQELGCRFGDIVRGIAPSAGSITSSVTPRCTGSVAVLHMQSDADDIVPMAVVTGTRDLWVMYNGFDAGNSRSGVTGECVDYSTPGSAYPVQWCLHHSTAHDGHAWWAKADEVAWNFFSSLSLEEPTSESPPGGGNEQLKIVFPMTLSVTVDFPEDMTKVLRAGLFLYPQGSQPPISGAPLHMLNSAVELGDPQPGTRQYFDIPVKLPSAEVLPKTYALLLAVYVEGGSIPIPTPGVDLSVVYELTINDPEAPVVIEDVLYLQTI
ncbi:MAG: hypothetical protein CL799_11265 [Chromatiales bacterium]|nr:hypothetical protein [Chromatiales bacterium]MDP6150912.1 hypothetical protein [Gammaproteobacteria bacterium]MDP7271047.1 hypothetical protein [Gammaproteobacteria bacterium]HJP04336.1 hypothetical protein [Gammaproteobacteria bacterium]